MISLETIEQDLTSAMKAKDSSLVQTLRALKTRLQNEKVAKMKELSEEEVTALIRSEVKRRKEAAEAFKAGGRQEQADAELHEASLLERYLPAQLSEEEVAATLDRIIGENGFTAADFGKAMGIARGQMGQVADGAVLARILKEKLK